MDQKLSRHERQDYTLNFFVKLLWYAARTEFTHRENIAAIFFALEEKRVPVTVGRMLGVLDARQLIDKANDPIIRQKIKDERDFLVLLDGSPIGMLLGHDGYGNLKKMIKQRHGLRVVGGLDTINGPI